MQALSLRWAVLACLFVLTSCAVLTRDPPPISRAAPFEFRQIRFLPLEDGATIRQTIERSFVQETAESYVTGPGGERALKGIPWRTSPPGYAAPQGQIAQE